MPASPDFTGAEHLRPQVTHADLTHVGLSPAALLDKGVPAAVVLAAVKVLLCERIDAQAEGLRLRLISPGVGQVMEYQEARAQALAALAAPGAATAGLYPMLAASIGLDRDPQTDAPAADVLGVARSVLAASAAWGQAGAAIRAVRLAAKAAVNAAETGAAAVAAAAAVSWPSL